MPLRHGGTLNSSRTASPLVRLAEGKERWEAQDALPQNWDGKEPNCTVTCMVLKAKANDRRHLAMMNFVGLDLSFANQKH
ncbi:cullin-4A [Trichonephila clavipes]|nr:cullin-4A [Trichonephila clavipes]